MSPPLLTHALPVHAQLDGGAWARGWLVRVAPAPGLRVRLPRPFLREPDLNAWWAPVPSGARVTVDVELAVAPRTVVYCAECAAGLACAGWRPDKLRDLGYAPARHDAAAEAVADRAVYDRVQAWAEARYRAWRDRPAAPAAPGVAGDVAAACVTLGVAWPCTADAVRRAFRVAAAREHPDHGGTDESIRRVIAARETLERATGATSP